MLEIKSELMPWYENNELLYRLVPAYDFDDLLCMLDRYDVSAISEGHYSYVFRIRHRESNLDATLKLMRYSVPVSPQDFRSLFLQVGKDIPESRIQSTLGLNPERKDEPYKTMVERQVSGHVLGNLSFPGLIDNPIAIWVRKNDLGSYHPVGYSIPFIEGEAYYIRGSKLAVQNANKIEADGKLYLGSRWSSQNVILKNEQEMKFIDVRLSDEYWEEIAPAR